MSTLVWNDRVDGTGFQGIKSKEGFAESKTRGFGVLFAEWRESQGQSAQGS
jgi:hypothetical protein